MKRVIFSVLGTIAGLVALLDFKAQGHPAGVGAGAGLPSATLPSGAATTSQSPAPSSTVTSPAGTTSSTKTVTGSAIQTQYGVVQVKVTVTRGKIANVSFVQLTANDFRSQQINQAAAPILLQETLSAQSAQVDTVSGASFTSEGYRESLQSALDQAGFR